MYFVKNLTIFLLQRFMNEIRGLTEVNIDVKLRGIIGCDAVINECVSVVVLVPDAALLCVCSIQYMRDAQLLQRGSVLCNGAGHRHIPRSNPVIPR